MNAVYELSLSPHTTCMCVPHTTHMYVVRCASAGCANCEYAAAAAAAAAIFGADFEVTGDGERRD